MYAMATARRWLLGVNWELCRLQYMLSQQTIDALRKPAFDVWLWESNEVRV